MLKLFTHQELGAAWLAGKKYALLADEMRVGKTMQAIRACDLIGAKKILVICPAVARFQWTREFERFQNRLRSSRIVLSGNDLNKPVGEGVLITSYALVDSEKLTGPWDVIIVDEAHYLKSCDAKRTKQIYGRRGLVHKSKRVWLLTGTPAPNNVAELWPMLYVFRLYRGDYETFVREFCIGYHSPYGFQISGSKNIPRLRKLMKNFILRRRLAEVRPELPPITFSDYVLQGVELSENKMRFLFPEYLGVVSQIKADIKYQTSLVNCVLNRGGVSYPHQIKTLEGLTNAVPTLRRYVGITKVDSVAELVKQELDAGLKKIVLFCIHRDVINFLQNRLEEYRPAILHGGTTPQQRESNLVEFKHLDECRVFIGQVMAAGVAIDLSVASEALFVESSWVPGDNIQAAARLQNINKTQPVNIRFIGLADSIDEHIQRVVRRKTRDLTQLFD